MVMQKKRLLDSFLSLIPIDSESGRERAMHDELARRLVALGLAVRDIGSPVETERGAANLYATLPGDKDLPVLLFNAHMDTVSPGQSKKAVQKDGKIYSDGSTILGADDCAGITIILELLRCLVDEKPRHSPVRALFTVNEEVGLLGSRGLKPGDVSADFAFVLDDSGPAGTYIAASPAHDRLEIEIIGRAAHAGVEPEAGVSAVSILADALRICPIGRADNETTCNIGTIHGGQAMNMVCPQLNLIGEARSVSLEKLDQQVARIRSAFESAASARGGRVHFKAERLYCPIRIDENTVIAKRLRIAAENCGLTLTPVSSGGGTDASVLAGHGIPSVTLSVGYHKMHSCEEYLDLTSFYQAADLACELAVPSSNSKRP